MLLPSSVLQVSRSPSPRSAPCISLSVLQLPLLIRSANAPVGSHARSPPRMSFPPLRISPLLLPASSLPAPLLSRAPTSHHHILPSCYYTRSGFARARCHSAEKALTGEGQGCR